MDAKSQSQQQQPGTGKRNRNRNKNRNNNNQQQQQHLQPNQLHHQLNIENKGVNFVPHVSSRLPEDFVSNYVSNVPTTSPPSKISPSKSFHAGFTHTSPNNSNKHFYAQHDQDVGSVGVGCHFGRSPNKQHRFNNNAQASPLNNHNFNNRNNNQRKNHYHQNKKFINKSASNNNINQQTFGLIGSPSDPALITSVSYDNQNIFTGVLNELKQQTQIIEENTSLSYSNVLHHADSIGDCSTQNTSVELQSEMSENQYFSANEQTIQSSNSSSSHPSSPILQNQTLQHCIPTSMSFEILSEEAHVNAQSSSNDNSSGDDDNDDVHDDDLEISANVNMIKPESPSKETDEERTESIELGDVNEAMKDIELDESMSDSNNKIHEPVYEIIKPIQTAINVDCGNEEIVSEQQKQTLLISSNSFNNDELVQAQDDLQEVKQLRVEEYESGIISEEVTHSQEHPLEYVPVQVETTSVPFNQDRDLDNFEIETQEAEKSVLTQEKAKVCDRPVEISSETQLKEAVESIPSEIEAKICDRPVEISSETQLKEAVESVPSEIEAKIEKSNLNIACDSQNLDINDAYSAQTEEYPFSQAQAKIDKTSLENHINEIEKNIPIETKVISREQAYVEISLENSIDCQIHEAIHPIKTQARETSQSFDKIKIEENLVEDNVEHKIQSEDEINSESQEKGQLFVDDEFVIIQKQSRAEEKRFIEKEMNDDKNAQVVPSNDEPQVSVRSLMNEVISKIEYYQVNEDEFHKIEKVDIPSAADTIEITKLSDTHKELEGMSESCKLRVTQTTTNSAKKQVSTPEVDCFGCNIL